MKCIIGSLPQLHHIVSSLVNVLLLWTSTHISSIPLIALFGTFYPNFNFMSHPINNWLIICMLDCQQGKSPSLHFCCCPKINQVLHLNQSFLMFGDLPILPNNGAHYCVVFVDHFSKFTWLYSISCKYDVSLIFAKVQAYTKCFFHDKIKSIQMKCGGEYTKLCNLFASHEIHHRIRCPIPISKMG